MQFDWNKKQLEKNYIKTSVLKNINNYYNLPNSNYKIMLDILNNKEDDEVVCDNKIIKEQTRFTYTDCLASKLYEHISSNDLKPKEEFNINLDNTELLKLTKEFYKSIDTDKYELVNQILKTPNFIQLNSNHSNLLGETFFNINNEYYIYLDNSISGLKKLFTFVHEISHIITFINHPNVSRFNCEIPSINSEKYLIDFLRKNYFNKDIMDTIEFNSMIDYLGIFENKYIKRECLKVLNNKEIPNKFEEIKKRLSKYNLKKEDIIKIINLESIHEIYIHAFLCTYGLNIPYNKNYEDELVYKNFSLNINDYKENIDYLNNKLKILTKKN